MKKKRLLCLIPIFTFSSLAYASSINLKEGIFEFNGIATLAIISGLYCIRLGYKTIMGNKSSGSIDIDLDVINKGKMSIKGAASGVAFVIFGALIIIAGVLGNIQW